MLYFSKLKITLIALFTLFMVMVSSSNFLDLDLDKQKKIKLGLDLQGGSYLLLELDNEPVIKQKLQSKLLEIKDYFKKNKIKILFCLDYQDLGAQVKFYHYLFLKNLVH